MSYTLLIDPNSTTTKIRQIVDGIRRDLEKGTLVAGTQLPSITAFSKSHGIARDTVEKAYNILKDEGLLISVPGKGMFTNKIPSGALKILMILNKMSSYKKEIYEGFIEALGENAAVDIQIHHYDPKIFMEIMERAKGQYHYYAIMPHFFNDADLSSYLPVIESINPNELLILDKQIPLNGDYMSIYQDFSADILEAMESAVERLSRYSDIVVVFPKGSHHPTEILSGIAEFCERQQKSFSILSSLDDLNLIQGQVYIALTESELAALVKKIRMTDLKMGKDIGIISFNETVLKELLDIAVISTDFRGMGTRAAELILTKTAVKQRNSFSFIPRGSL